MSDVAIADAPATDSAPASVEDTVQTPNPISTEPQAAPEAKVEEKKPEPTPREALRRAAEKVEAGDKAEPKAEKPAPVKSEAPARAPDGKFAGKEPAEKPATGQQQPQEAKPATVPAEKAAQPASDAPARFSADAKAAWATAPEPVKAEVHRAIREMEAGIEKHRASSEAFEPIRRFHEQAVQSGTTLEGALTRYTGWEAAVKRDPIHALASMAGNIGLSPQQLVAAINQRFGNAEGPQPDHALALMRHELAQISNELNGFKQATTARDLEAHVAQFAADKPRFDELSEDIAKLISTGYAKNLQEAYEYAERLKPAPSAPLPDPTPTRAAEPDLTAQTLKGSKSLAGAPSTGSDPEAKPASKTVKDAVKRAFQAAG